MWAIPNLSGWHPEGSHTLLQNVPQTHNQGQSTGLRGHCKTDRYTDDVYLWDETQTPGAPHCKRKSRAVRKLPGPEKTPTFPPLLPGNGDICLKANCLHWLVSLYLNPVSGGESPETPQVSVRGLTPPRDSPLWGSATPRIMNILISSTKSICKLNKANSKLQIGCNLKAGCWAKAQSTFAKK